MAIAYVGGRTAGFAGTTSAQTVSLGSLTGGDTGDFTPQAGDLVIVTYAVGSTSNETLQINTPGGGGAYTLIGAEMQQADTFDANQRTAYKFMGGTPDTQVVLTETNGGSGSTSNAGRYTIDVFRGVDPTTPLDVAAVTAGGISSSNVDPGSITPITTGAWIYIAGMAASGTGSTMTASGLTDVKAGSTADTNDASILSGIKINWVSGAFDHGVFGSVPSGTTANSWTCISVALRPAAENTLITPGIIALTLATFAAIVTVTANQLVTPTTETLAISTFAPTVTASNHKTVTPSTTVLSFTEFAPTVTVANNVVVTPYVAGLSTTGFAPVIAISDHKTVVPGVGSLTTSLFAPTVVTPRLVTPSTVNLALEGFTPTVATTAHQTVTPIIAELALTSFAPTVTGGAGLTVTPDISELALTTFVATVTATNNILVTPDVASLSLQKFIPVVTATDNKVVTPGITELVLEGFTPVVGAGITVIPQSAELTLSTFAPRVLKDADDTAAVTGLVVGVSGTLWIP